MVTKNKSTITKTNATRIANEAVTKLLSLSYVYGIDIEKFTKLISIHSGIDFSKENVIKNLEQGKYVLSPKFYIPYNVQ